MCRGRFLTALWALSARSAPVSDVNPAIDDHEPCTSSTSPPCTTSSARLAELDLRRRFGLDVLEVRRGDTKKHLLRTVRQHAAGPATIIRGGDMLYVRGERVNIDAFAAESGVDLSLFFLLRNHLLSGIRSSVPTATQMRPPGRYVKNVSGSPPLVAGICSMCAASG